MTKPQERTLSMFLLVINYLKTNLTLLTTIPQFTAVFTAFENIVNDIVDTEQLRITDDSGIQTASKKDIRMQCTTQLQNLIDMLKAHAVATNDSVLSQKISIMFSKVKTLADTAFAAECNKYYAIAEPLTAALAPYGINAAYMIAFRQNIDDYTDIITTPRTSIINRADSTAQLKVLFTNGKKELDKLTIFVTTKRLTDPRLYSKYMESIRVIDNGSTPHALRISLKAQDGTPLRAFTFTFTRQADGKVFEYKTNENGTIVRPYFKEGTYNVTITKTGYTPATTVITLEPNITYRLNATANTDDKTITVL
jgi:Carboxypeptidase regulatory-like domain